MQDMCKVCTRCVQGVRKMCARCVQDLDKHISFCLLLSTVNVGEANKDVTQHQGIRAALNRASIEFAQFTLSSYHIYYAYFQNMINDANMQ